ncbi:MAG: WG repeat-containing protein [Bacteroides sp.]|nr:WG repeat-containing protein [Bacteroides sp.]
MKYCKKRGDAFADSQNYCSQYWEELSNNVKEPKKSVFQKLLILLLCFVAVSYAIIRYIEYEKNRISQNKLNALMEYSCIGEFNDFDVAVVAKNYADGSIGYGLINHKYEEVIPCVYNVIMDFYKGKASAEFNGKYVVIDTKGRVLDKDEYYKDFEEKYECVLETINKDRLVGRLKEGGSELLNVNLVVISQKYWSINVPVGASLEYTKYGLSIGEKIDDENIYSGFINWDGVETVSPDDIFILRLFDFFPDEVFQIVHKKRNLTGFINITNGEWVAPMIYDRVGYGKFDSSGNVLIAGRDGGKVFINRQGEEVSALYKEIRERGTTGEFYVTDFHGRYGVINRYGEEIVECQPYRLWHLDTKGYYMVDENYNKIYLNSL